VQTDAEHIINSKLCNGSSVF